MQFPLWRARRNRRSTIMEPPPRPAGAHLGVSWITTARRGRRANAVALLAALAETHGSVGAWAVGARSSRPVWRAGGDPALPHGQLAAAMAGSGPSVVRSPIDGRRSIVVPVGGSDLAVVATPPEDALLAALLRVPAAVDRSAHHLRALVRVGDRARSHGGRGPLPSRLAALPRASGA